MGLLQNKEIACFAMLPNVPDVPFLGQCSVAELHKLNENGADGAFRNRANIAKQGVALCRNSPLVSPSDTPKWAWATPIQ